MTQSIKTCQRGISLKEAWTRIGVKKTKFHALLKQGEFDDYYVGSRHLVVEASVDAWIERRIAAALAT